MHKMMGIAFPTDNEDWISCGRMTVWVRKGQTLVVYWDKELIYINEKMTGLPARNEGEES